MLVESFECTETISEPIEAAAEAIALMEKLGLEGQKSLVKKAESGFDVRCPYRKITKEEFFVYRTLCPTRTKLSDYSDGPIPLRVLQIAAHATELGIGPHLHVWHRAMPVVKDPVLVATDEKYINEWSDRFDDKIFILARWGEELEAFATLLRKAVDVCRGRLAEEARALSARADSMTASELIEIGPRIRAEIH